MGKPGKRISGSSSRVVEDYANGFDIYLVTGYPLHTFRTDRISSFFFIDFGLVDLGLLVYWILFFLV